MLRFREGETRPHPFRSGRFFSVNGEWYFGTRERPAMGPFVSRQHAEQACAHYLRTRTAQRVAAQRR